MYDEDENGCGAGRLKFLGFPANICKRIIIISAIIISAIVISAHNSHFVKVYARNVLFLNNVYFFKLKCSASGCVHFKTNLHCEVLDLSTSSIWSRSKVFAKHGKVQTGELGRRGSVGISVPVACFQHKAFNTKISICFFTFLDFVLWYIWRGKRWGWIGVFRICS